MELYEKIRNLREYRDIKQKDIAKHLHLQPTTYNSYEMRKRTISAEMLKTYVYF